jgi:hypothetical protein
VPLDAITQEVVQDAPLRFEIAQIYVLCKPRPDRRGRHVVKITCPQDQILEEVRIRLAHRNFSEVGSPYLEGLCSLQNALTKVQPA